MYRVPTFPCNCQHLFLSAFLIIAILVWSGISWAWFAFPWWMTNGVKHCFMYLWPFIYLVWRIPLQILCPFLYWVVLLNYKSTSYILDSRFNKYIYGLQIFPPHFMDCLFTHLMMSFEAQKFLILIKSLISIFPLVAYAFDVICKKLLPNIRSQTHVPVFSYSFIVLALPLMSLIHFELVLYIVWDRDPTSFFCIWLSTCPNTICWKDCYFPVEFSWHPFWKSVDP